MIAVRVTKPCLLPLLSWPAVTERGRSRPVFYFSYQSCEQFPDGWRRAPPVLHAIELERAVLFALVFFRVGKCRRAQEGFHRADCLRHDTL